MHSRTFLIIKELKDMLLKKITFISEVILFGSQV